VLIMTVLATGDVVRVTVSPQVRGCNRFVRYGGVSDHDSTVC
jgi:hypothetical protein